MIALEEVAGLVVQARYSRPASPQYFNTLKDAWLYGWYTQLKLSTDLPKPKPKSKRKSTCMRLGAAAAEYVFRSEEEV